MQFDTMFMANVIHVIENPSLALQECYRILKDDGLLIINFYKSRHEAIGKNKIRLQVY